MKSSRKIRRTARRLFRLCLVSGVLDEARTRTIARRVAQSGRRGSFPVLWEFLRLVRIHLSRRTAVVESAVSLPAEMRDDIGARLTNRYGAGLATTFAVNPALVGGTRIRVGSDIYDGSVRARLAALEARL